MSVHGNSNRNSEPPPRGRGELGPPGILVTRQLPTGPSTAAVASCLRCRMMVVAFHLEDEGGAIVGLAGDGVDRLGYRARASGAPRGAGPGEDFAPICPGATPDRPCRGLPHFEWGPDHGRQ